jgi:DNA-binding NarL/FixJ family response regulator
MLPFCRKRVMRHIQPTTAPRAWSWLKKAHPRTQVVVFSNMSVPSEVKHAIALGAAKYLTKSSFTPKEIVAIIKDVLNAGEKQSAGK